MYYEASHLTDLGQPHVFITRDGVVVRASASFEWAIGKSAADALEWCQSKRFRVAVGATSRSRLTPFDFSHFASERRS